MVDRVFKSAITKAYLTSILGIFSGLLTQLFFIKQLTSRVDSSEFSLYAFVFQVVGYFAILQLGLDFATSREISLNLGKKLPANANYSYWFIRRFNKWIIFFVGLISLLTAILFYYKVGLPDGYNSHIAMLLVFLFGLSQINTFIIIPQVAALIGSNMQHVANLNNVIVSILSTLLAFIFLINGAGVFAMPLALIFWGVANYFFLLHLVNKHCVWKEKSPIAINKQLERRTIKYSLATTAGGLAWTIEATSDVIILNAVGLLNMVGLYVIWWRFPQMLFDLVTRFTISANPAFALAHGRSVDDGISLFQKVLIIASGGGLMTYAGIAIWLPSFVEIWIGRSEYLYPKSDTLAFLMGLLVFCRIIGNCLSSYLISTGDVKITTKIAWAQAIGKVILATVLLKSYSLNGLLIASVCASLLQVLFLTIYLYRKKVIDIKLIFFNLAMLVSGTIFSQIKAVETNLVFFLLKITITAIVILGVWALLLYLFGYKRKIITAKSPASEASRKYSHLPF